ncbi:TspO/MBR family protein [uncultured Methanoregula sp.]|uniref:TspO/MBR family protein n=1 Tax=uncultured Methanoregula sp. TaxID=1005933 RepID=UPI002AABC041|nr:TspO/MBR family protein [uncultured Methanoregula sp.]
MKTPEKSSLSIALLLVASVGICLFAGVIGSVFSTTGIPAWYAGLIKPAFTPPAWIFAPVWTFLYILMGISLFLILRSGGKKQDVRVSLSLFAIQLVLNVMWSVIFFGLHSIFFGLVCLILLFVILLCTTLWTFRVSRNASLLLIPYLLWLCIAAYLNTAIFILNPV